MNVTLRRKEKVMPLLDEKRAQKLARRLLLNEGLGESLYNYELDGPTPQCPEVEQERLDHDERLLTIAFLRVQVQTLVWGYNKNGTEIEQTVFDTRAAIKRLEKTNE